MGGGDHVSRKKDCPVDCIWKNYVIFLFVTSNLVIFWTPKNRKLHAILLMNIFYTGIYEGEVLKSAFLSEQNGSI
jgi:hypothetical protein